MWYIAPMGFVFTTGTGFMFAVTSPFSPLLSPFSLDQGHLLCPCLHFFFSYLFGPVPVFATIYFFQFFLASLSPTLYCFGVALTLGFLYYVLYVICQFDYVLINLYKKKEHWYQKIKNNNITT